MEQRHPDITHLYGWWMIAWHWSLCVWCCCPTWTEAPWRCGRTGQEEECCQRTARLHNTEQNKLPNARCRFLNQELMMQQRQRRHKGGQNKQSTTKIRGDKGGKKPGEPSILPISSLPSTSPRTVRESYEHLSDSSREKSAKSSWNATQQGHKFVWGILQSCICAHWKVLCVTFTTWPRGA